MTRKPTSVRLDEQLLARLDTLGEAYDRSRGWLIAEAVRRFLEEEEAFKAKVEAGLRAADEGRFVSKEEHRRRVKAHLESLGRRSAAE